MAYSGDQLSALTQQVMADPSVQQAMRAWQQYHASTGSWGGGHGISPYEQHLRQAMTAAGMPPDTRISFGGPDGAPHLTNPGLPGWAYPVIGAGIAAGAYFAAPSIFTGGAHAAAGGAGVAGNATGSVVGDAAANAAHFSGATDFFAPPAALSTGFPATAATGTAAAAPSMLTRALGIGIPTALTALTNRGGNQPPGGANGLTPELQQQLNDLLAFQKRRLGQQEPVHEAAMRMAMNLSQQPTNTPRQQATTDPQVLDAIRQLASGMGR